MLDQNDTPLAPITTAAVPPTSTVTEQSIEKNSPENPTPIWLVVAIAALISVTSSYAAWFIARSQSEPGSKVVIVDMASIAIAKGFTATAAGESPEASAKKFLSDMNAVTKTFTEKGILVVNSQVAFNRPTGMDVTDLYEKALGVDLGKAKN